MPTTRKPWPSTRATKQTTLLVPISSAAITPFLVFATLFPRRYAYTGLITLASSHWPHHTGLITLASSHWPGRGLARTFSEIELIRQPEIDNAELARQQSVLCIELGKLFESRHGVFFRQPDLHALVQDQIPAALRDPHGRTQLADHRRLVGKQQQEFADVLGCAGSAQQQQGLRARRHAAGSHRPAVAIDQGVFVAVLPDGDGATFLHRHIKRIRQAALDRGARHPVDGFQALTRRLEVDAQERISGLHVERREDGALLHIVAALDGDVGQLEWRDRTDDAAGDRVEPVARLDQPAFPPRPPARAAAASQQQHDEAQQQRLAPERPAGPADRSALPATVVIAPWRLGLLGRGAHVGRLAWSTIQVISSGQEMPAHLAC